MSEAGLELACAGCELAEPDLQRARARLKLAEPSRELSRPRVELAEAGRQLSLPLRSWPIPALSWPGAGLKPLEAADQLRRPLEKQMRGATGLPGVIGRRAERVLGARTPPDASCTPSSHSVPQWRG